MNNTYSFQLILGNSLILTEISKVDVDTALKDVVTALTHFGNFVSPSICLVVKDILGNEMSSSYSNKTGIFRKWVGSSVLIDLPRSVQMKRQVDLTLLHLNGLVVEGKDFFGDMEDLEEYPLSNYHLITPTGEKPIFGYDGKTFYTACGQSMSVEKANIREIMGFCRGN